MAPEKKPRKWFVSRQDLDGVQFDLIELPDCWQNGHPSHARLNTDKVVCG
jgi:hypothetical protein